MRPPQYIAPLIIALMVASGAVGCSDDTDQSDARLESPDTTDEDAADTHNAPDSGDSSTRTKAEVCRQFQKSSTVLPDYFTPGTTGDCDPGALSRDAIDDTLRRINFYRWLGELSPTVTAGNAEFNDQAQMCALLSAWNAPGPDSHHPKPSAKCYTQAGATGAGTSNIAWGLPTHGPLVIDRFMDDQGNETTLGHRRHFLNPKLGEVGVGIYKGGDNYGAAACVKVLGTANGNGQPPPAGYTPYPPAGYVPMALTLTKLWSISGAGISENATLSVTDLDSGSNSRCVSSLSRRATASRRSPGSKSAGCPGRAKPTGSASPTAFKSSPTRSNPSTAHSEKKHAAPDATKSIRRRVLSTLSER